MGEGTGPIEYLVANAEASASADLLRAAGTLAAHRGDMLQRGVLVTGFSQGGQAAMALGRELQSGRGYFGLRALAPVSGPYELLTAQLPGMFNGQVAAGVQPYYAGFVLTSWNALYHLYAAPADAFRAPYASQMAGLFSGRDQDAAVMAALPSTLGKLLTPAYLGLLRHPRGQVLRAMQANNTCAGWTPDVPVKLFAARGDTTVTQVNAEQCARAIRAGGGHAQMVRLGNVGHELSGSLALPQIARWFSHLT